MSKQIFIIYDKKTYEVLKTKTNSGISVQYYGMGAARGALTRLCKKSGIFPNDPSYPLYQYTIADRDYYTKMTGKTI